MFFTVPCSASFVLYSLPTSSRRRICTGPASSGFWSAWAGRGPSRRRRNANRGRGEIAAYRACGTACLREAENRDAFLEAPAGEGIDIEVIGPPEEARLTWE